MHGEAEARIGGSSCGNVVESNLWSEIRLACLRESVGVHLMPGPDQVASELNLLAREAAGEVEMGVDKGDMHRSNPWPWHR